MSLFFGVLDIGEQVSAKIEMEKWNGDVMDINETVWGFRPGESAATSRCPCTVRVRIQCRNPFGKRKIFSGGQASRINARSPSVLGKAKCDPPQLQEDQACTFFLPLYGQKSCTT
ncbi:hypothetical protein GWK47_030332 [Chionoecetes opilio]|uniref:Uncharacterized protein n=1 Tax=Chionoecetes opilio TaxID=41210 RepID=A0A8J5CR34_CHIOP|nr:hypothetical protein GWK47_030332 [Chionoecetes opilio]